MEKHVCSKKNCPCGGSIETKRYRKDANIWYCDIAYAEALKQRRGAWKKRREKPMSPTCRVLQPNGDFCGKPTFKLFGTTACCLEDYNHRVEEKSNGFQDWYEENKEAKKQYSKDYHSENRESILARQQNYRATHKDEMKLNNELLVAVMWYRNFQVMKSLNRNFNFYTFCDQQSRDFVINDFFKVGLFIKNEHSLILPKSLRNRKSIDCSIVDLGLYIETKSTEATYKEKETQKQVDEYKALLEFEIANGYTKEHKATFISWSPTGDNAEMSLREFYLFIKDKVKFEYKRLGKDRFKKKFPTVKYMALLKLCDKRVKQLMRVEKYSPKSPKYNRDELKQGLIEKLLTGEIVFNKMNMNLLREKYGQ